MTHSKRHLNLPSSQSNVLNTIRTKGSVTRREIASISGLRQSVVTSTVMRLIQQNYIKEKKSEKSICRGRRPSQLMLNPNAAYTAGVQLTDTHITCVLTNFSGELKYLAESAAPSIKNSPAFWVERIETCLRQSVESVNLNRESIRGVGLIIPDILYCKNSLATQTSFLQAKGDALSELVQKRLKIPVMFESYTNALAMAHIWNRSASEIDHLIVISMEKSIGLAVIINGQLFGHRLPRCGQFGHTVVVPGGFSCRCGKNGCIEAYAGELALMQSAQREWTDKNSEVFSFEDLIDAAQHKDLSVENIFRRAGAVLGLGISGFIQFFTPAQIIISGKSAQAGEMLLAPLQEAMRLYVDAPLLDRIKIAVPAWQQHTGPQGASLLALNDIYRQLDSPLERV